MSDDIEDPKADLEALRQDIAQFTVAKDGGLRAILDGRAWEREWREAASAEAKR